MNNFFEAKLQNSTNNVAINIADISTVLQDKTKDRIVVTMCNKTTYFVLEDDGKYDEIMELIRRVKETKK